MARLILKSPYIKSGSAGGYMKYIATRPRAEKLGTHGLFGDEDDVDLDAAMREMESVTGNVWTHIISLTREGAERMGYDNANAAENSWASASPWLTSRMTMRIRRCRGIRE